MKELAMRMERLPSSLVAHKRVAALNTKLAEMGSDLVSNPLGRNLIGYYNFRRYNTKAPDDADYAFEKLNDLCDEEIQSDESDEDSLDESTRQNRATGMRRPRTKARTNVPKLEPPEPQTETERTRTRTILKEKN